MIPEILKQYSEWKEKHPDEDWQYDEISEWLGSFSRSEMIQLLEWAESKK
jgi:hypothetical protein